MCKQIFSYYFFVSCSRSTALRLSLTVTLQQSIHNSHRCAWISEGFCSIIALCQPWKLVFRLSKQTPSRARVRTRCLPLQGPGPSYQYLCKCAVCKPPGSGFCPASQISRGRLPHTATRGKLDSEVAEEYEIPKNSLQCLYF